MPYDPKINRPPGAQVPSVPSQGPGSSPPKPTRVRRAAAEPTGHAPQSSFDPEQARQVAAGPGAAGAVTESHAALETEQAALRAALFERLETPRYLDVEEPPPSQPADLPRLGVKLQEIAAPSHAATLLAAAQRDPVVGARLERVLEDTATLPEGTRASLLAAVAIEGAGTNAARVIDEITRSTAWERLTTSQQVQLSEVMTALTAKGLEHLGALIETNPDRLLEQDSQGHTLLSNLSLLGAQPLNASLYRHTTTAELLETVLRDLVNPARLDEGDTTNTTVSSVQYELAADDRAEYTRLIAGLSGPTGSLAMRGGATLALGSDDAGNAARRDGGITAAVFQPAAIAYASDGERPSAPGGLGPTQQARLLAQLFKLRYSADAPAALHGLRGFDAGQHLNRPVLVDFEHGAVSETVTLERVADGRIVFRDPYGELRSMPEAAFAKVVVALHQPVTA